MLASPSEPFREDQRQTCFGSSKRGLRGLASSAGHSHSVEEFPSGRGGLSPTVHPFGCRPSSPFEPKLGFGQRVGRGIHRSVEALHNTITDFIEHHNADPKTFRWTKSADDILASIKRFCQRPAECFTRSSRKTPRAPGRTAGTGCGELDTVICENGMDPVGSGRDQAQWNSLETAVVAFHVGAKSVD